MTSIGGLRSPKQQDTRSLFDASHLEGEPSRLSAVVRSTEESQGRGRRGGNLDGPVVLDFLRTGQVGDLRNGGSVIQDHVATGTARRGQRESNSFQRLDGSPESGREVGA